MCSNVVIVPLHVSYTEHCFLALLCLVLLLVLVAIEVVFNMNQGDHLSGKPGNVKEFDSCPGNVRDFTKNQGNVREKI